MKDTVMEKRGLIRIGYEKVGQGGSARLLQVGRDPAAHQGSGQHTEAHLSHLLLFQDAT
jgi:hypothetical protein